MSDGKAAARGGNRRLAAVVAAGVLLLALGAVLWPRSGPVAGRAGLLVFDPSGNEGRRSSTYPALAAVLAGEGEPALPLNVVRDRREFAAAVALGPAFVLCPDGVALGLDREAFTPLVAGRRAAPRNLRPRSVLVRRRTAPEAVRPWIDRPAATILGDSLSLAATAAWRAAGGDEPPRADCTWGPDPYDHGAALHALRLGCFDYAVVRQWDLDRFVAAGLLDPVDWAVDPLSAPVPDVVLLASRELGPGAHLAAGEKLAALGRGETADGSPARRLSVSLDGLGLVGFNLVIDPDFELARRNFPGHWPRGRD